MLLGMLSSPHAYSFIVQAQASNMLLGSIQRRKRYGMKSRIRGDYGVWVFLEMFGFLLSTREPPEDGGTGVEVNGRMSRLIEGWEEGFIVFIYTPVFTVVSV